MVSGHLSERRMMMSCHSCVFTRYGFAMDCRLCRSLDFWWESNPRLWFPITRWYFSLLFFSTKNSAIPTWKQRKRSNFLPFFIIFKTFLRPAMVEQPFSWRLLGKVGKKKWGFPIATVMESVWRVGSRKCLIGFLTRNGQTVLNLSNVSSYAGLIQISKLP